MIRSPLSKKSVPRHDPQPICKTHSLTQTERKTLLSKNQRYKYLVYRAGQGSRRLRIS
jgi:hypothetical protein